MKKEEILKKLRYIKLSAENDLETNNFKNSIVKNVIHYNKKVELINKQTGKKEEFDLYAVITENTKPEKGEETIFEIEYFEDKKGKVFTISDLIKEYEGFESIKDVVDKTKENEEKPEEEQDERLKTENLNELEEREKEEKKDKRKEKEEIKEIKDLKISDLKGEVNLDQQINGETLRKILGLGEEYRSIAPVRASTVGVKGSLQYCFVAIKNDKTCIVLGEESIKEDKQKGNNPYDKDVTINNEGDISTKSSLSNFRIAKRPNLVMSVRFDENSSTRETTISDISGRKSREEDLAKELHKEGDNLINSDARNLLREEHGIGASDETIEKQKAHENSGCENERVENIDENQNNDDHIHIDPGQKIEGTDITWKEFAHKCGYRENDGIERAYKKFKEYEAEHKELANKEIVENIIEDIENQMPGPDREKR